MELFDTHAHMVDKRFDEDREALLGGLPAKGIRHVLEAATTAGEVETVLGLVERYPFMVAAIGTHPHEAAHMAEEDIDLLRGFAEHPQVVAIGEIGLDYHYDFSPRDVQKKWFIGQLELAKELMLPVVLHVREADGEALDILKAHRDGLKGVMHCFSGSYETAKASLDMGLYIAFGGALTFHSAKRAVEIAAKLPMDRLLIETDCPYMTPEPYRGKRNDPSLVGLVCERLASIRGMDVEEVGHITMENGKRLFGIA